MSNFFTDVLGNVDEVQQELLGPNYEYWRQVKTPSEMGMSSSGNMGALGRDVSGLINYVQLLVAGGGGASKVNGPMGNKFFLKTGGKCKDKGSGREVDRYIYVNNVPDGEIPFISQAMDGMTFNEFRGLVPGTMSALNVMNPFEIFQAFMMGTVPDCQPLTMETIDANNVKRKQTEHVATVDISNMNACWFSDRRNPVNGKGCREAFGDMKDSKVEMMPYIVPDEIWTKLFHGSLGVVAIYVLYKLMRKQKLL